MPSLKRWISSLFVSLKLRTSPRPPMDSASPPAAVGTQTRRRAAGSRSGTITWNENDRTMVSSLTLPGTVDSPPNSDTDSSPRKGGLWRKKRQETRYTGHHMKSHASSRSRTLQGANASDDSQDLFYAQSNVSSLDLPAPVEGDRSSEPGSRTSHEEAWSTAAPADEALQTSFDFFPPGPHVPTHSTVDMLCTIQSTVLDGEVRQEDRAFAERDNESLRGYFAVRTNIVLTSTCPEVAPHVVITPAEENAEGFYTPYRNRVDYHLQDPSLLTVPWCDPIRLARKPYLDEECYWPAPRTHDGGSVNPGISRRVFCRSHFNHLMEVTANERLTMYHVVTALQRHRLKAVAIEACERAKILRDRYNDEAFIQALETPFQWVDPAEPLLKWAGYPGIVIFDSPNPFAAPHIMLCSPPQQDPWIPYVTATNDPQDGGFGRYLVVPSPHVSFVNMEGSPFYDHFDSSDEEYDSEPCDSPSEPASPEPMTPMELEDDDRYISWGLTDIREGDGDEEEIPHCDASCLECPAESAHRSKSTTGSDAQELPARTGKSIFYFDDEEDDELPPLDDWYLSVAQRNGVLLSA